MKKSILLVAVLMALVSLCLVFASCDSGSSDSSDPTPPPAPVTCTVSFDAGEGTGNMEPVTVEKGASYQVPACAFTAPSGKEFKCWNNGTADINVGETIVVGSNITLYAEWTDKPVYTISFKGNDGSKLMDDGTATDGIDYTIPTTGYTAPKIPAGAVNETADIALAGWSTVANGTVKYAVGAVIPAADLTGDMTLYAQWAKPSFSVSTDKKVYFAKGNLYWDGSSFKIYEKQTDLEDTWNESKVDKFYWSKTASVTYAESYSDDGANTGDIFFTNDPTDAETANPNFTVNGEKGKYRTLSKGEWTYLFNTRTDADKKVGYGTVCEVKGIILLPDVFTDPKKNKGTGAFVSKATIAYWNDNIYSDDNWSAMEAAGAVFLPAAGGRRGSSIIGVGNYGLYWSSSPDEDYPDIAYVLYFYYCDVDPARSDMRGVGYSVRLVCGE